MLTMNDLTRENFVLELSDTGSTMTENYAGHVSWNSGDVYFLAEVSQFNEHDRGSGRFDL